MGNTYKAMTCVWVIDSTGTLDTTSKVIEELVFIPSAAAEDLVITDTSDNTAIALKAGPADASPVHISFPAGRRIPSVKVGTIDGGTAYLYYRTSKR